MMAFSQKSGYAILAMASLHGRQDGWVLAQDISEQTGIPLPYLHKILGMLGQSGLVHSKRGYRGGIALSRPSNQITVLQVLDAIEGHHWKERCLVRDTKCSDIRGCPVHRFWDKERHRIETKLGRINLSMIAGFEHKEAWRLSQIEDIIER